MTPSSSKPSITRRLSIGLVLFGALGGASAQANSGAIRVENPWTRATPTAAAPAGGYMSLTNTGREADRLLDVTSPIAGNAEIHTMETVGDVARMRWQRDGIALNPGQTLELKPGGVHIMLMRLSQPIAAGMRVPVTLVFERAGKVPVDLVAAPLGTTSAPPAHSGAQHGTH